MKKNEIIAELKCENMNLQTENQRLQNCYDNICSFKHDFGNIMQAIGGYIEAKDIVGLKEMYSSIIQECQDINDVQSINKDIINNPAVYTLINSKYKMATDLNINMKVDVLTDITKFKISDLNLCRILGILIDNAIEAVKECKSSKRVIEISMGIKKEACVIVIKNPYENKVQKDNYGILISSKREKYKHGYGVKSIMKIADKYQGEALVEEKDGVFSLIVVLNFGEF